MEIIQQINELIETNESLKEENRKFGDTLDEKDEAIKHWKNMHDKLDKEYMEMNEKLTETIKRQKTWENNYIKSKKEEIQKLTVAPAKKDVAIKYQKETINALTKENQNLNHKLAQKSNQLDLCDGKLSQNMNSLRSKLANRNKRIEELEQQVTIKPNHMVSKDNEIAVLGEDLRVAKAKIQKMDGAMDEIIKSVNKIGYVKHKLVIGRYNNDKPKYKTCFLPEDIVQHLKECPQKAPLGGRPVV